MPTSSSIKTYYPFLDGFRAIAILWVMLHHATPFLSLIKSIPLLSRLTEIGFLGVDIFFVISGFLITGLLINDLDYKIQIKRFYIRRFLKIVPHYATVILVISTFSHIDTLIQRPPPATYASYFVFLQNYVPPILFLEHLWSIAVEEHFYLFYALLLAAICKSYVPRERRMAAIWILLFLILLGNYIRYACFLEFPPPYTPPILFQETHIRFDALIMGCLIKFMEGPLKQWAVKFPQLRNICGLSGAGLFFYLYFQYDMYDWFSYTLVYLAASFLIMAALLHEPLLVKFTENPQLRWIGKNSYGIYLWHYPIAQIFIQVLPFHLKSYLAVGIYAAISIYLGSLTTRLVENYFLRIRDRVMP